MTQSILLAVLVLAIAWSSAAACWYFARKFGEHRKATLVGGGLFIGGLLFACFAYVTDSYQRRTTLFEAMAEGSSGLVAGEAAPVREYVFNVEHAGVEHKLLVAPETKWSQIFRSAAELHVELASPDDKLLLDESVVLQTREGRNRGWDSETYRFTPTTSGRHTLRVTVITIDVPFIHLHVEDPLKTDGKRLPGY